MPIVPIKDSAIESEFSLKPAGYLDMDNLDDTMKSVSLDKDIIVFNLIISIYWVN